MWETIACGVPSSMAMRASVPNSGAPAHAVSNADSENDLLVVADFGDEARARQFVEAVRKDGSCGRDHVDALGQVSA
jgi:hypothetical protein